MSLNNPSGARIRFGSTLSTTAAQQNQRPESSQYNTRTASAGEARTVDTMGPISGSKIPNVCSHGTQQMLQALQKMSLAPNKRVSGDVKLLRQTNDALNALELSSGGFQINSQELPKWGEKLALPAGSKVFVESYEGVGGCPLNRVKVPVGNELYTLQAVSPSHVSEVGAKQLRDALDKYTLARLTDLVASHAKKNFALPSQVRETRDSIGRYLRRGSNIKGIDPQRVKGLLASLQKACGEDSACQGLVSKLVVAGAVDALEEIEATRQQKADLLNAVTGDLLAVVRLPGSNLLKAGAQKLIKVIFTANNVQNYENDLRAAIFNQLRLDPNNGNSSEDHPFAKFLVGFESVSLSI